MAGMPRLRYPTRVGRWTIALMLVASMTGCVDEITPLVPAATPASDTVPSTRDTSTPETGLWPGERLVAEIALRGITVGRYELWASQPCAKDGHAVMPVSSRGERAGLAATFANKSAQAISWLDLQTGRPIETRSIVDDKLATRSFAVAYGGSGYQYVYHRQSKRSPRQIHHEKERALPPHTPGHDMHSGLGLLRKWSSELGKRGTFYSVIGRTPWRVDVEVVATEQVSAAGTTYDAVRLNGTAGKLTSKMKPSRRSRAWTLWISDEAARLPIKGRRQTRRGVAEAELVQYEQLAVRPTRSLTRCQQ